MTVVGPPPRDLTPGRRVVRLAVGRRGHRSVPRQIDAALRLDPDADQAQVEFFGNRTTIGVPMFDGDHQIGPLVVPTFADQGVMPPTNAEFEFIVQVASLVAVVIGRMRAEEAHRKLEEAAAASDRCRQALE